MKDDFRSFNIFTKDSFRERIEKASKGRLTVVYDNQGNPSIMLRLIRKRIKDVLDIDYSDMDVTKVKEKNSYISYILHHIYKSNDEQSIKNLFSLLDRYYPCFEGYVYSSPSPRKYIPEILIGIFPSTAEFPFSMPGIDTYSVARKREDYYKHTYRNICETVAKKGKNWRLMSIWEYSLIRNFYLYKLGLNNCSKTFRNSTGTLYINKDNIYYVKNQNSTETSSYKVYTVGVFVSIPSSLYINIDVNTFIGKRLLGTESNVSGNIIEARKTKIDYSYLPNAYEPMLEGTSKGIFFVLNEVTGDVFFKKKEKVKILDEEKKIYYELGNITSETFILGRRTFNDNLNFNTTNTDDEFYELFMFFESFTSTPLLIDGLFLLNSIYSPCSNDSYKYSFPSFFSYRGQIILPPSSIELSHPLYHDITVNNKKYLDYLKTSSNGDIKIYGKYNGVGEWDSILKSKFIFYNCTPVINRNIFIKKEHKYLRNFLNYISFIPINLENKKVNMDYLKSLYPNIEKSLLRRSLLCFDINRNEIYHNEIRNRFGASSLFVGWDYDDEKNGLLSVVDRPEEEFSTKQALYMFLMGFNNNYLKLDLEKEELKTKPFYNKIERLNLVKKFSKMSGNFFIRAYDSDFYVFSNGASKVFSPSTVSYELFDTLDKLRKDVRCIDNPLFNAMFHSGSRMGNIKDDPHPDPRRFDPNIVNDDMDMLCDAANKFIFRLVYVPEY